MPSTTKVTMVTPVVRERLNSQGLLMPKIPKKIPNRHKNSTSFKMNTMVRFSFLMVCMAKLLSLLSRDKGQNAPGDHDWRYYTQYAGKSKTLLSAARRGRGKCAFPFSRRLAAGRGSRPPRLSVGKAPPFEKGRPPRHAAARAGRARVVAFRIRETRSPAASASRLGKRKSYAWDATCVQAQLGGDNRTRTCDLLRVKQAL